MAQESLTQTTTLNQLAELDRYNHWIFERISHALLVPARRFLYGEFDRALGHFRRYGRRELAAKLEKTGFVVREMNFFSLDAALPWLINERLLKRDYIPAGRANLANLLVPLLKLERLMGPPCGLSLIAIAQK